MRGKCWYLIVVFGFMFIFSFSPVNGYSAGKHDSLICTGCHSIHDAKGPKIFAVEPNKVLKNPADNKAYPLPSALCLGCHTSSQKGGMDILPVLPKHSHPFGVKPNPKVAVVPDKLLRQGRLECVSCHDPHPSNPNYKYLRVDTKGGGEMDKFCALCHPAKTDVKTTGITIFDSMDERKATPPIKTPTKKKTSATKKTR